MKFALVNNQKIKPIPKTKGKCVGCRKEVISKCGKIKVWHWAHSSKKHCDSWWENEGEWHRKWKSYFPESCQEIPMRDKETGELHIADIQMKNGLIIELQNSAIGINEVKSRENFYKNMIWIVNAEKFKENIKIGHELPSLNSDFSKDIIFHNRTQYNWIHLKDAMWHLKSENPSNSSAVQIYLPMPMEKSEIISKIKKHYTGNHFFYWKRPRVIWLISNVSVFFDFGGDSVWQLNLNHPNAPRQLVIKRFLKEELIASLIRETEDMATASSKREKKSNENFTYERK